jgi:hypothetical protein
LSKRLKSLRGKRHDGGINHVRGWHMGDPHALRNGEFGS